MEYLTELNNKETSRCLHSESDSYIKQSHKCHYKDKLELHYCAAWNSMACNVGKNVVLRSNTKIISP